MSDRLHALYKQESTSYKISDYMDRQNVGLEVNLILSAHSRTPGLISQSPCGTSKKRKVLGEDCAVSRSKTQKTVKVEGVQSRIKKDELKIPIQQEHWREKMAGWSYQVVDHFDLNREVVCVALNYLDRFLAIYPPGDIDKNGFQLLAMTCLYLAIKLYEYSNIMIPGAKSSMDTILQLSRGYYTLEQMQRMELDLVHGLQWNLHPPTPQVFISEFLSEFSTRKDSSKVEDIAVFMVELAVMDSFFVPYKPSEIALAALLNATQRLFTYSNYDVDFPFWNNLKMLQHGNPQVVECQERLEAIYSQSEDVPSTHQESHPQVFRTSSPVSVTANFNNF